MSMKHRATNEQLVALIKSGEDTAGNMEQLCRQVEGFIRSMAWRYRGYAELEDLIQEGYLALYPAVSGYDPAAGYKFLTYAGNWIRQAMTRYIQNNGTVRISVHEQEQIRRYERFMDAFYSQTGREPSERETAYYLGMDPDKVRDMRIAARSGQVQSLDAPVMEEGEGTLGDAVPDLDDMEAGILDRVEAQQLKEVLWDEVDSLPDVQPQVIRSLFQEGNTLKQTGEQIGASTGQVRAIEDKALRELARPGHSRKLAPFLPEVYESQAYKHNGVEEFNRTWTSSTERLAMKL